jgi:DNA-binding NarL/FixJ family response regulator
LIAAGKSTKIIAQVLDSTESDIEALRKKLLHETNCQNVAEYIGKAKDNRII